MHRLVLTFVCTLSLIACGNEDDGAGTAGSAGTSASGSSGNGSGGAVAGAATSAGAGGSASSGASSGGGASDVRAALSLNLLAPQGCRTTAHFEDFPIVDGGHPVTTTGTTQKVVDGGTDADGSKADVQCQRLGSAAPFQLSAGVAIGAGNSRRSVAIQTALTAGATAGLVLSGPGLGDGYAGSCIVEPLDVDASASTVFGKLTCSTLKSTEASDACALAESYFYFEGCAP